MGINPAMPSFKEYVFCSRHHKINLVIVASVIVIQFSVFKYLYPYPSFIHEDSYKYLETAYFNFGINSYMVGYSRFLRLFSVFSSSDTALVAFQYLFVQSSALFFLGTLFYFYRPQKIVQIILLYFMALNPLFLYMANLISSDCYFLSLSMVWFALLLWIIHQPSTQLLIWHTVVLFIAFTVRYNALIYPFIAMVAFMLSNITIRRKLASLAACIILCGLFILYTGNKYKALTGIWQYAPFSGWQLANNAMYAYRFVDSAERKPVLPRFQALDNAIRIYFDSTRDIRKYPKERLLASTFYMWDRDLPLWKYIDVYFRNDSKSSDFKKWAMMGPFYRDYGIYIIKEYPWFYARYFLWPNANKYYAPPGEYLEMYNTSRDSVVVLAKEWFGYKSSKISTRLNTFKIRILDFYPILSGVMNIVFLCCLLCFFVLRGFRNHVPFRKGVLLTGTVWVLNAGFSIFSTAAALRFMAFPILLMSTFVLLLIDWMWDMMKSKSEILNVAEISKEELKPSVPQIN
jgi:hypothetical protein